MQFYKTKNLLRYAAFFLANAVGEGLALPVYR